MPQWNTFLIYVMNGMIKALSGRQGFGIIYEHNVSDIKLRKMFVETKPGIEFMWNKEQCSLKKNRILKHTLVIFQWIKRRLFF